MFTAALFIKAKNIKLPKSSSTDEKVYIRSYVIFLPMEYC